MVDSSTRCIRGSARLLDQANGKNPVRLTPTDERVYVKEHFNGEHPSMQEKHFENASADTSECDLGQIHASNCLLDVTLLLM